MIEVYDNPNSTGDYAVLPAAIGDSLGGGSLLKAGNGTLYLQGATSNTYSGMTTIMGTLVAAKTGGATAIPGNVTLSETGDGTGTLLRLDGDNQLTPSCAMTFSTPLSSARLELNGHAATLSAINGDSHAVIEGLSDNTGLNVDSTLTIDNAADCTFAGVIRDKLQGSGTGRVNLVKNGAGSLLLGGINGYTGPTVVNDGMLQVNGSIQSSPSASVGPTATLYFNSAAGYFGCGGPISGSGTVQIYQGAHAFSAGAGGNTSLSGFAGLVSLTSGVVSLLSPGGLGSGAVSVTGGASYDLATSATMTFSNPITLGGIGGTLGGVAMPALYGGGNGGAYTISAPITLLATSDVGNSTNNGTLILSGKITGPGGLVVGKSTAAAADQDGALAIAGTASNDYGGDTAINRGTVYLQKSGGAIAIPGNLNISPSGTTSTGNTYLILNASNQIAPAAVITFASGRQMNMYFELQGNDQTLGGIVDYSGRSVIENAELEPGINNTGTLTIDNTANCKYVGAIRNGAFAANGASTGLLALVKSGPGTLTLGGSHCGDYTGGLTVNAGTLDYSGATVLPGTPLAYPTGPTGPTAPVVIAPCPYTINGGRLNIGELSASIGAFTISGGTVSGTGTLTSNAAYDVRGGRVEANLAGNAIGLTKSGASLAVLTGTNSYSGRTTLAGGVLELGPSAQDCVLNLGGADVQSGRWSSTTPAGWTRRRRSPACCGPVMTTAIGTWASSRIRRRRRRG